MKFVESASEKCSGWAALAGTLVALQSPLPVTEEGEMEERRLIEELVTRHAPNATVVDVEPTEDELRVTIAGTTGVVARCELRRAAVEAAHP